MYGCKQVYGLLDYGVRALSSVSFVLVWQYLKQCIRFVIAPRVMCPFCALPVSATNSGTTLFAQVDMAILCCEVLSALYLLLWHGHALLLWPLLEAYSQSKPVTCSRAIVHGHTMHSGCVCPLHLLHLHKPVRQSAWRVCEHL